MMEKRKETPAMASVLVIDVSDHVCEMARLALTMAGHEVATTTDSQEGERLIYDTTTLVVLLNLTMPPAERRHPCGALRAGVISSPQRLCARRHHGVSTHTILARQQRCPL
jgi:CheY-like chemotaxis protein